MIVIVSMALSWKRDATPSLTHWSHVYFKPSISWWWWWWCYFSIRWWWMMMIIIIVIIIITIIIIMIYLIWNNIWQLVLSLISFTALIVIFDSCQNDLMIMIITHGQWLGPFHCLEFDGFFGCCCKFSWTDCYRFMHIEQFCSHGIQVTNWAIILSSRSQTGLQ